MHPPSAGVLRFLFFASQIQNESVSSNKQTTQFSCYCRGSLLLILERRHTLKSFMDRTIHGRAACTLDKQFLSCFQCKVKINMVQDPVPTQCPLCQHVLPEGSLKAFSTRTTEDDDEKKKKEEVPERKRLWVIAQNKEGKPYFHNTQTGEDQWRKPTDYEETVTPIWGKAEKMSLYLYYEKLKYVSIEPKNSQEQMKETLWKAT